MSPSDEYGRCPFTRDGSPACLIPVMGSMDHCGGACRIRPVPQDAVRLPEAVADEGAEA